MMDDRFEDVLKETAQDYNAPPETPRELMWARIEATRAERARRRQQLRLLYSPWTRWGVAVAAALAIGIGLGRMTIRSTPETDRMADAGEAAADAEASYQLAFRVAATNHMSRAETFLASFRSDPQAGSADQMFFENTSELLTSTRLLLDSPAAQDPVTRGLLEDLELILVQIKQLSASGDDEEVDLVTEGLEQRGLLPRLRTVVPAGRVAGS
jgi:hypothetical protein